MPTQVDASTLQAALIGYQSQLAQIDAKIAELRKHLGRAAVNAPGATSRRKHQMSAAGREAIAEGQRKRWAEFHKGKRQLSPEAKTKLAANLAKARAARAAKAKAASA